MLQALALRYRPRNFDELIGQEAVSKSLIHALDENRLTHAYLFSGLRGSGKTSSARIFSKALVCEAGVSSKPCEKCLSCQMSNEGRHIDIIEMDAASHRGIEDIKGLIEQTKYAPATARFKIFIIDEVHMLSTPAFNALLKTLEEPPSYVKFILATTDPLKLPATVLSRTQHFRFKQISKQNIISHLNFILNNEKISFDSGSVELLARSGSGSLRDTLTLLDQAIIYSGGELSQTKVAQMLGLLDPARIDEILTLVLNGDKKGVLGAINELESYDAEMIIDEIIANLKENFLRQSHKYSLLLYERFFRILSQAKSMLGVSSDNGFVLSVMFFMMIEAINLKSIDDMVGEISQTSAPKIANSSVSSESKSSPQKGNNPTKPENSNQEQIATIPSKVAQKISLKSLELQAYELFVAKIYDRDFSLGECFERCNEFESLQDGELLLKYDANDEDKALLRTNWSVIQELLRASLGSVKIKTIPCKKDLPSNELSDVQKSNQDRSLNAQKQLDLDENFTKSAQTILSQNNLNEILDPQDKLNSNEILPNQEMADSFAPDLESMRDDSDDFGLAYGVKNELSLEFLDEELQLIKSSKIEQSEISFDFDDATDESEKTLKNRQNFSFKERIMQNVSQNANFDSNEAKNSAILKEANRLFGDPIVRDLPE